MGIKRLRTSKYTLMLFKRCCLINEYCSNYCKKDVFKGERFIKEVKTLFYASNKVSKTRNATRNPRFFASCGY